MSVIFGLCNFKGAPVNEQDILAMAHRLNHWNADRKNTLTSGTVAFGHLMFYNTPQSLSEQLPWHSTSPEFTITADARLDNRGELFSKLNISERDNHTLPDSTLILKTYAKYGRDCVKHLIGDFAFAIYDHQQQIIFCARDHMGVKPFMYCLNDNFFAFASEKKGILTLSKVDRSINKQYLFNHLLGCEQYADQTLYQHIQKLNPAHTLVVNLNSGQMQCERYWLPDVETELRFNDPDEYYEGLRHHFEQAVQCRTLSAYNLGVELSGGMDSSAITGAAVTYMRAEGKELFTLSNTLDKDVTSPEILKLDERRYIDAVNEYWDIKNTVYITKPAFEDQLEQLKFALEVNDGFERWNPLWQLSLKKEAKAREIRTLLSGFPGDELVTYRGKYYFLDYLDKKQYIKYFLAEKKYPGFNKIEPILPFQLRYNISKIKRLLNLNGRRPGQVQGLYNIPKSHKFNMNHLWWHDQIHREQFNSYRHFQRQRILKPQVTHRMESETRYGLYFRTEPRFPMADIRLIQYYLSMPNELKYEGELARTAYRKAVGRYLPPLILERDSKYGSVAPFLSLNKPISPEQINELIKQLPVLRFLRPDDYFKPQKIKSRSGQTSIGRKYPPPDVLLWLVQNQEQLKSEGF